MCWLLSFNILIIYLDVWDFIQVIYQSWNIKIILAYLNFSAK
jgi:hypothetical protein